MCGAEPVTSPRRPFSAVGPAAVALSVAGLVAQVTDLAGACFQRTLNSDHLIAHALCREAASGVYPISGWKFGMGTFFFPDYPLYLPWFWAAGDAGWSYAGYAVTLWVAYFFGITALLRATGASRWSAALASGLGLNLLLATRGLDGAYADRLWQLSLPAYHGGNVALELFTLALVFGAVASGGWSRGRRWALASLVALGAFSNALLVLHVILPVGLLLAVCSRRCDGAGVARVPSAVCRGFLGGALAGVAVAVVVRLALMVAEVFFFARMFKAWPWPHLIWERWCKFWSDFAAQLWPETPVFWVAIGAAAALSVAMTLRHRRGAAADFFPPAALAVVMAAVFAAPIAAVYWKDGHSFRYMLPLCVLAVVVSAYAAVRLPSRVRMALAAVGVIAVAVFGVRSVVTVDRATLVFPKPASALALRDYLRANGLKSGLCHFWENNLLQSAWGYDGPRLSNIRDEDFCEFWCNNAFAYFPRRDGVYAEPEFDFVILQHLDAGVLAGRLGGRLEPVQVGPYTVARLTPEQAKAASALVRRQALDFLEGRRADAVSADLSRAPAAVR